MAQSRACANSCSIYVMCAAQEGKLDLASSSWNMEPQPEMVFEENATTSLQERVLIDRLFDLYEILLEVCIQKKFFAAWSGNTRRRGLESGLPDTHFGEEGGNQCVDVEPDF